MVQADGSWFLFALFISYHHIVVLNPELLHSLSFLENSVEATGHLSKPYSAQGLEINSNLLSVLGHVVPVTSLWIATGNGKVSPWL